MKSVVISILPAAIIAIFSCTNEDGEQTSIPINFSAGVSIFASTKAPVNNIDDLEPIQILRSDGTADYTSLSAPTLTGTINSSGAVTPSELQFYAHDGTSVNFMAFYPQASSIGSGIANFIITGQEDIMVAPSVYGGWIGSKITVNFAFTHKLAQIQFLVKAENSQASSSWGTLTYIKINTPTSLDLTLITAAFDTNSNAQWADLPTSIGGNASQTLTTTATTAGNLMLYTVPYPLTLKVKTSNIEEHEVIIGLYYLQPGNQYTITLTFKGSGTGIPITASLTGWSPG